MEDHEGRATQRRQRLDVNRLPRRRAWLRRRAAAIGIVALAAGLRVSAASAQTPSDVTVSGTLTAISVDNLDDRISAGRVVVGKERVVVPSTVIVQMPGNQLTLQELFTLAPARCRETRESGLVPADACRRPARDDSGRTPSWTVEADRTPRSYLDPTPTGEPPPTVATVVGTRTADGVIARSITLTRSDESVWGAVTFVNRDEGYLRINGSLGVDTGGALLRLNDPDGRQSAQSGAGCGEGANCSPDVRFKMNTVNASVRFAAGGPACIPGGLGDACSPAARSAATPHDLTVMLPIVVGDHITALGGFEVREGIRVFWAHTLLVHTPPGSGS